MQQENKKKPQVKICPATVSRAKINKQSLGEGDKKHEKFSLILPGLDFVADEQGNRLQNCIRALQKTKTKQKKPNKKGGKKAKQINNKTKKNIKESKKS